MQCPPKHRGDILKFFKLCFSNGQVAFSVILDMFHDMRNGCTGGTRTHNFDGDALSNYETKL